ncbi:DUF5060 domain-containing protein [Pelagicoccus sp. SDUM812005]|uniref:DUF5060 domain-containing protein n=1 Tax=Pelagicoccus sp. SDUM812005 TaxID=3041257 RepID=UPI00280D9222|nr:DUF5060 domain-containing protein [Pelagicoccus sp. SDUM812005]MDQ8179603.1 DUF5060 domain-containing protein [Pelagicoccus sp. SDUM812005]
MKEMKSICFLLLLLNLCGAHAASPQIDGELRKWHRVTLTFDGPESSEDSEENPFLNYRLWVTFSQEDRQVRVPGYYAADGEAGESGASVGNKWRAHFSPDAVGEWTYKASFRKGREIALSDDPDAGEALAFDGSSGRIEIEESDKDGPDFRGKGRLDYVGDRYLRFAETGEIFLKAGPDSPENFLAFTDFDETYSHNKNKQFSKDWAPHVRDWNEGDPTWRGGKGKGIIGAVNYLSDKGMNVIYFITKNIIGDGQDVWPYTDYDERFRFDCSKLDQWEIVFEHMTRKGIMLNVVTQERENDQLLDGGELGPERKLYYRELIARFAHHPALVWNLGEENTNTVEQVKDFCDYFASHDPYGHPKALHTVPYGWDVLYRPMLGHPTFEVLSVQTRDDYDVVYSQTVKWIERSRAAGREWPVFIDEVGMAWQGVEPDAQSPNNQGVLRRIALYPNLMGGGSGVEWYFGYEQPHNDLTCQDWRTRDRFWDIARYSIEVMGSLPLRRMYPNNELIDAPAAPAYCLAAEGEIYAVYFEKWQRATIDLREYYGSYRVKWFNPRTGEGPYTGSEWKERYPKRRVPSLDEILVEEAYVSDIGLPPFDRHQDWLVLIERVSQGKVVR